jgi:hypothetical protein
MQSHLDNVIFISKDDSEMRIPYDKTILIMDYFALDGKGYRKRIKPNIKYQNFNYVPKTEEEKKLISKIDEKQIKLYFRDEKIENKVRNIL